MSHQNLEYPSLDKALEEYRKTKEKLLAEEKRHLGIMLPLDKNQELLTHILKQQDKKIPPNSIITVYNPSIIFEKDGQKYISARVELADKSAEHDSILVFFVKKDQEWVPLESPIFPLQDPNITWLDNQMIMSGVEIIEDTTTGEKSYQMAFYSGENLNELQKFAVGPARMKGIRLTKLPNGKIGVYTRPQGIKGNLGQIGFTIVDASTDKLITTFRERLPEIIEEAPLITTLFPEEEWGGVNQIINLTPTLNLIIGHRAKWQNRTTRHYYPYAFLHNLETGEVQDLGVLAERNDFPEGGAKAQDLFDVLYTGGIVKIEEEDCIKFFLIVGISDFQSGLIEITNAINPILYKLLCSSKI